MTDGKVVVASAFLSSILDFQKDVGFWRWERFLILHPKVLQKEKRWSWALPNRVATAVVKDPVTLEYTEPREEDVAGYGPKKSPAFSEVENDATQRGSAGKKTKP